MKLTKKLFILCVVLFTIGLIVVSYDIARKTTFPGSKPQLKERIKEVYLDSISTKKDSTHQINLKN